MVLVEKVDFSYEDVVSFGAGRNFPHEGLVELGLGVGLWKNVFDRAEAGRIRRQLLLFKRKEEPSTYRVSYMETPNHSLLVSFG